jgi:hypothetical protein
VAPQRRGTERARTEPVRAVNPFPPPPLTPERAHDLVARGLPEPAVSNGNGKLDYASLTSGSMADRLRNGYA